ncbi:MAG: MFS transporter [Candidatus Cloacimonadota bacterium]|nr:MAG: MFS transporter [Candidatus Cloacimonadota bacterium]
MKLNKNVLGWIMYDFANSSFTTIIVTVVYSVYFVNVVAENPAKGTMLWSTAISLSMFLVAVSSPVFGAIADFSRSKKKFLFINTYITIIFTALLYFVDKGDVLKGMIFFVVANFGFNSANVFYNAFLPEIAEKEEVGRVSGLGWAFGYVGGLLSLVICLPLVHNAVRWVFPVISFYFFIFSLVTFFWLKEFKRPSRRTNYFKVAFQRLAHSYKNISKIKQLKKFLISYFVYNDAVVTVIAFGAIYGKEAFDMSNKDLLIYFILMQVTSMVGAAVFGFISDKIGCKKTIQITLLIWISVVFAAFFCRTEMQFYGVGLIAGLALGSSQSASRSMLALLTPENKNAEFFGFFAFSGKLAAIAGPLVYGFAREITGSQRWAVLTVSAFFVAGFILLLFVDEKQGIKEANNWEKIVGQ